MQSDTRLTPRQKRVLLDIYESFRKENAAAAAGAGDGPGRGTDDQGAPGRAPTA